MKTEAIIGLLIFIIFVFSAFILFAMTRFRRNSLSEPVRGGEDPEEKLWARMNPAMKKKLNETVLSLPDFNHERLSAASERFILSKPPPPKNYQRKDIMLKMFTFSLRDICLETAKFTAENIDVSGSKPKRGHAPVGKDDFKDSKAPTKIAFIYRLFAGTKHRRAISPELAAAVAYDILTVYPFKENPHLIRSFTMIANKIGEYEEKTARDGPLYEMPLFIEDDVIDMVDGKIVNTGEKHTREIIVKPDTVYREYSYHYNIFNNQPEDKYPTILLNTITVPLQYFSEKFNDPRRKKLNSNYTKKLIHIMERIDSPEYSDMGNFADDEFDENPMISMKNMDENIDPAVIEAYCDAVWDEIQVAVERYVAQGKTPEEIDELIENNTRFRRVMHSEVADAVKELIRNTSSDEYATSSSQSESSDENDIPPEIIPVKTYLLNDGDSEAY